MRITWSRALILNCALLVGTKADSDLLRSVDFIIVPRVKNAENIIPITIINPLQ